MTTMRVRAYRTLVPRSVMREAILLPETDPATAMAAIMTSMSGSKAGTLPLAMV